MLELSSTNLIFNFIEKAKMTKLNEQNWQIFSIYKYFLMQLIYLSNKSIYLPIYTDYWIRLRHFVSCIFYVSSIDLKFRYKMTKLIKRIIPIASALHSPCKLFWADKDRVCNKDWLGGCQQHWQHAQRTPVSHHYNVQVCRSWSW